MPTELMRRVTQATNIIAGDFVADRWNPSSGLHEQLVIDKHLELMQNASGSVLVRIFEGGDARTLIASIELQGDEARALFAALQ